MSRGGHRMGGGGGAGCRRKTWEMLHLDVGKTGKLSPNHCNMKCNSGGAYCGHS